MVGVLELLVEQRELFAALFDLTGEKRKIVLRRKPLREIGAQLKYIFRRWIERRVLNEPLEEILTPGIGDLVELFLKLFTLNDRPIADQPAPLRSGA